MWISKKRLAKIVTDAYELGLRTGTELKHGGIYQGLPKVIRDAERILRESK